MSRARTKRVIVTRIGRARGISAACSASRGIRAR